MDAALELSDVYLTLPAASGPVEILKGVSFRAMPGESVAVVGPSGSGKSSLIAVSTGIERATKGEVKLLGESLTGKSEDGLARLRRGRVSLVFQSFHLLGTMNAFDNVRAPLEIAGLAEVDRLAKSGLEAVGLGARMDHYPGQLSGGERQRVAVARALASNPAIVFADEPTGNLDRASGAMVADMLFAIARDRNATLIVVTHDLDIAKRADRIVEMSDGRIVMNASRAWLRIARRELAGGLGGFWIYLACLALGAWAIAAAGSITASFTSGLEIQSRVLLGGDAGISVSQREASEAELAWMRERSTAISQASAIDLMGRKGSAVRQIDVRGVDASFPLLGSFGFNPGAPPLADVLARREGAWGIAASECRADPAWCRHWRPLHAWRLRSRGARPVAA